MGKDNCQRACGIALQGCVGRECGEEGAAPTPLLCKDRGKGRTGRGSCHRFGGGREGSGPHQLPQNLQPSPTPPHPPCSDIPKRERTDGSSRNSHQHSGCEAPGGTPRQQRPKYGAQRGGSRGGGSRGRRGAPQAQRTAAPLPRPLLAPAGPA